MIMLANQAQALPSVDAWHVDIQKYNVGRRHSSSQRFQCLLSIACSPECYVAVQLFECHGEEIAVIFVIVVSIAVLISGTLREAAETQGIDFAEMVWISLLRTLDPGTMGGDSGSVPFVLAMLTVTLGGIFIVATLIGVISSGIQSKLEELRKGRSQVLETNHTVILGWSAQIFEIIRELISANENKRRQRIVVLADRDRVLARYSVARMAEGTIACYGGPPCA